MKTEVKFMETYTTRINGIPVQFEKVLYVEKFGEKLVLINFHSRELMDKICHNIIENPAVVTEGLLLFIRSYLNYSLQDMSDQFLKVSKTTIADWEKNPDKMVSSVANSIRIKMINKLALEYSANQVNKHIDMAPKEEFSEHRPLKVNDPFINIETY